MEASYLGLFIFFTLSITLSFVCSMLEAVLLSITPSYIEGLKESRPKLAGTLLEFKQDIDKPLAAILTLNTVAHTVGAMGVGAQASKLFSSQTLFSFLGYNINIESIIAVGMTLAILVLSEIIPKTVGVAYWKQLTPISTKILEGMIFILKYTGILWLLRLATTMVGGKGHGSVLSRQDFAAMTHALGRSGEIQQNEYTIIKNLLSFEELTAKDIMTPRTIVVMAEESQTLREYYDRMEQFTFSRIPLYKENKDEITGILLKDDLLEYLVDEEGDMKLSDIKREVTIVSETKFCLLVAPMNMEFP
ncbi:MAG: hemolysin [Flavobacteriaceae bacterium]|nr:MAG: hemolysin [Flavobacteriaceae bacterium]